MDEEFDDFDRDAELALYREYRDVVTQFQFVVDQMVERRNGIPMDEPAVQPELVLAEAPHERGGETV